jgi:hypothetical protein
MNGAGTPAEHLTNNDDTDPLATVLIRSDSKIRVSPSTNGDSSDRSAPAFAAGATWSEIRGLILNSDDLDCAIRMRILELGDKSFQ